MTAPDARSATDDLRLYYERELTYLRRLGAEFAERYPQVAGRLKLEAGRCEDPHVERLLEGFAFLTARLQLRIADDLPQVSEALLDILYPQYVRPLPSFMVVELEMDRERGKLPGGFFVKRGTELRSRLLQGRKEVALRFRTCFDTTLWPAQVSAAGWTSNQPNIIGTGLGEAVGAIKLSLSSLGGARFGALEPASRAEPGPAGAPKGVGALRIHLAGESTITQTLYELLANSCLGVVVRDPDQPTRAPEVLPPSAVRPVGFEPDEMVLPYPRRTFGGYALLQELFAYPEKFLFFDIEGVAEALVRMNAGPSAELHFVIAPFERPERRQVLEVGISPRTIRIACVPAVNLFEQVAEPIQVSERQPEYLVVPDARRRFELDTWSIDKVTAFTPGREDSHPLDPLYAVRHESAKRNGSVFWQATRRASGWRLDGGADVMISFADRTGQIREPGAQIVSLHLTCFNGDLPSRVRLGQDDQADFSLANPGPVVRVRSVINPSKSVRPALGKPILWRLISSLSVNYLSLVEGGGEALRELLRLHNAGDSTSGEEHIQGLSEVRSSPAYARVRTDQGMAFARGRRIDMTFDETRFPGGGMFLFASVLERFLAVYTSMNSFTQLVVHSQQRRVPVRRWAPRSGSRVLL
ncbi:MAG TPA: type VI secretion system baseplate subunit TssF [Gemmatimonadaceae bacterium]|jgi:type VI secretion system protein ImpG